MIKLQAIGFLGKDCITNTVNGKQVINFSVAHTEKYRDNGGMQKEKTTWVECAYWTDKAAIAAYLKKGTQVYVEGQPEVKTYSKNDGSTGATLSLRVVSVQLLGATTQQPTQQAQQPLPAANNSFSESPTPVDDLPF